MCKNTKTELVDLGPLWKNKSVSREILDSINTMEVSSIHVYVSRQWHARVTYPGGYTGVQELCSVWFTSEAEAVYALDVMKAIRDGKPLPTTTKIDNPKRPVFTYRKDTSGFEVVMTIPGNVRAWVVYRGYVPMYSGKDADTAKMLNLRMMGAIVAAFEQMYPDVISAYELVFADSFRY